MFQHSGNSWYTRHFPFFSPFPLILHLFLSVHLTSSLIWQSIFSLLGRLEASSTFLEGVPGGRKRNLLHRAHVGGWGGTVLWSLNLIPACPVVCCLENHLNASESEQGTQWRNVIWNWNFTSELCAEAFCSGRVWVLFLSISTFLLDCISKATKGETSSLKLSFLLDNTLLKKNHLW